MLSRHRIIDALRRVALFEDVDERTLAGIAALVDERHCEPGACLCRQGEHGTELFLIVSGAVRVERGSRLLARLEAGEVFGELSVLDARPRSADVFADAPTHLLRLSGAAFQRLLDEQSGLARTLLGVLARRLRQTNERREQVDRLVKAFRERGHALARLDPLGRPPPAPPSELDPAHHGLGEPDLDTTFTVRIGETLETGSLRGILDRLRATYCGPIGWQYMHIDDPQIQDWLRTRIEDPEHHSSLSRDNQLRILTRLTEAEVFETFLQRAFTGAKRFSLEGAETLIPLLDQAIRKAGEMGVEEVVIGMAHRGRLNVLVNVLDKPADQVFAEFIDADRDEVYGGDVKYHLGFVSERAAGSGYPVRLSLCFNPSHLELVGPVVVGRARAKQDRRADDDGTRVLPLVIHGDAAFAGQGVNQELLNLSGLDGFATGGVIHVVLNNQIGFTTGPAEGRSTRYATDVARMLQIPIVHVNGEHPEAVDRVIDLAARFRAAFRTDVVIDLYCYRRHGHNELDDPTFTQPLLYEAIRRKRPVREAYVDNLLALGSVTREEADAIARRAQEKFEHLLRRAAEDETAPHLAAAPMDRYWAPYRGGPQATVEPVETRVPQDRLTALLERLAHLPDGFTPHPRAARQSRARHAMARGRRPVDWAAAEALAFASLLTEGYPVRLSGQDSARGTFAHRHAVLRDLENGRAFIPLASLEEGQARFMVVNSPLSELAVLGFEYGYSLDAPEGLVIWEAQFGDFANMAQAIIDQFIVASEQKWGHLTGLTLMLPHGFEGEGPEHSSARLERFLHLAADDNIRVAAPTTAAQLFHVLRRQVLSPVRKPLVLMTPKRLLQHPTPAVPLRAMAEDRFRHVLDDPQAPDPAAVQRVLLCAGRVYVDLARARDTSAPAAIVRIEQLYPFPFFELRSLLAAYPADAPVIWVQEEPENMGAWPYLRHALGRLLEEAGRAPVQLVSRPESASPAAGSPAVHRREQAELVARALGGA